MKLCGIPRDHELAKNPTLWDPLRSQVVELLDAQNCQFSSIELVSFTWLEEKGEDQEGKEDKKEVNEDDNSESEDADADDAALAAAFDSMPPAQNVEERRYTTPPTIWVSVLPSTLSGAAAYNLANEILEIVSQYNLTGVDVAFRVLRREMAMCEREEGEDEDGRASPDADVDAGEDSGARGRGRRRGRATR